jgi:hypothetical protein
MTRKLKFPKLNDSDLKKIRKDLSKGTAKALRKTFLERNINTVQYSILCALCVNMLVNVSTLATTCVCLSCSFFVAV